MGSRGSDEHLLGRRDFLVAAGGLVAATVVLPRPAWASSAKSAYSPLVLSSDLYASPQPQRFVFAVAKGRRFTSGAPATIRFRPPRGAMGQPVTTVLDRAGLPKGRGVYVSRPTFDVPGVWKARITTRGKRLPLAIQVNAAPTAPIAGTAAPRAASPTIANPLGVSPICTRSKECGLHTVSLGDVVGAGKPVVVMFATPARCQSQYCGPVLDELLSVMGPYGARVTFVHVEIYRAPTGVDLVPTVSAWKLPSEPWLFGIDAAGTIVARADGAMGGDEIKALIDRVAV